MQSEGDPLVKGHALKRAAACLTIEAGQGLWSVAMDEGFSAGVDARTMARLAQRYGLDVGDGSAESVRRALWAHMGATEDPAPPLAPSAAFLALGSRVLDGGLGAGAVDVALTLRDLAARVAAHESVADVRAEPAP